MYIIDREWCYRPTTILHGTGIHVVNVFCQGYCYYVSKFQLIPAFRYLCYRSTGSSARTNTGVIEYSNSGQPVIHRPGLFILKMQPAIVAFVRGVYALKISGAVLKVRNSFELLIERRFLFFLLFVCNLPLLSDDYTEPVSARSSQAK